MAEAHQAVSYSKLIKSDHGEINPIRKTRSKSWIKWLTQANRKLRNAVYPAHVESFWVISTLVLALHFASYRLPFNLVNDLAGKFNEYLHHLKKLYF